MSYRQNLEVILTALVARVPLYIEGAPGGGKTAAVEAVAQWLVRPLVTVVGATRDRTDFGGWPRYHAGEDRVKLYPFPWVQALVEAGERGILFLDEMNANEEIFPVLLRILAERYIGDIPFQGDRAGGGKPGGASLWPAWFCHSRRWLTG